MPAVTDGTAGSGGQRATLESAPDFYGRAESIHRQKMAIVIGMPRKLDLLCHGSGVAPPRQDGLASFRFRRDVDLVRKGVATLHVTGSSG